MSEVGFMDYFSDLEDPRNDKNKRYNYAVNFLRPLRRRERTTAALFLMRVLKP